MMWIASSCEAQRTEVLLWKTLADIPPMPKKNSSGLAVVNDIKMYFAILINWTMILFALTRRPVQFSLLKQDQNHDLPAYCMPDAMQLTLISLLLH